MSHSLFEDITIDMQSLTLVAFIVETIKKFPSCLKYGMLESLSIFHLKKEKKITSRSCHKMFCNLQALNFCWSCHSFFDSLAGVSFLPLATWNSVVLYQDVLDLHRFIRSYFSKIVGLSKNLFCQFHLMLSNTPCSK